MYVEYSGGKEPFLRIEKLWQSETSLVDENQPHFEQTYWPRFSRAETQKENDSVTWECKVKKKKLLSNGFASN